MKRLVLTLTVVLLLCLNSPAPTYIVPFVGGNNFELTGTQFAPGELVSAYFTPDAGVFPTDSDLVFFWNVAMQDFDASVPTYATSTGTWIPDMPVNTGAAFPMGAAFFYVRQGGVANLTRTVVDPVPAPLPALSPNTWYALSAQKPMAASYGDLVGNPSAIPNPFTFIWPWDVSLQDLDRPYRYVGSSGWKQYVGGVWTPATPSIPIFKGAFVGWFQNGGTPMLQTVTAAPGSCAPNVTLTLSFAVPVDPVRAASASSYKIFNSSGGIGGSVISATVSPPDHFPLPPAPQLVPKWHEVVLNCTLQSQPGNTYSVIPQWVISMGGTPNAVSFTFPGCGAAPANDTPASATALTLTSPTFATAVNGSLTCAGNTPALTVLAPYPPGGGPNAKDVWYSLMPEVSGSVAMDTCLAPPSGCLSDTVLAVYQGFPGALYPIPAPWQNNDGGVGCTPRSRLTFTAQACTTYYIRVSGRGTGPLPGDFRLSLVQTPTAPINLACLMATPLVSANRSTPFIVPASGSVWFRFTAPPGAGPWLTEIDTCTASFVGSAVSVSSGACPGTPVIPTLPMTCPTTPFTFMATAGAVYRIEVINPTANDGCGFLHVSSGIPALGTIPPAGACVPASTRTYTILGSGTAATWSWSLTAPPPCGLNIQGTATTTLGMTALQIAQAFRDSINNNIYNTGVGVPISATASPISTTPQRATLSVCLPTPCLANALVLKVGGVTPDCWVNRPVLTAGFGPCSFNPDIFEIGDPSDLDVDCNSNGQSDYNDILFGVSLDADGDGVPDECQSCVGAVAANGPDSTQAHLGGSATLAVQPLGSTPISYQWRKEGVPLPGQTGATLVLTNLPLDAAGLYDVIVTNACGLDTSPGAVLVVDPQPVLNIAHAGANVVLSWRAEDYQLQSSPVLSDPASWVTLPNASPATIPLTGAARYFRLQQSP